MTNRKRCAGFTIAEWVAIVGVVALLAAVSTVKIAKSKARRIHITCISQLKNIGFAAHFYATDNNGRMPGHHFLSDPVKLKEANALRFFMYLSNELVTPLFAWCPKKQ